MIVHNLKYILNYFYRELLSRPYSYSTAKRDEPNRT